MTDPRIEAAAWMIGSVSDLAPGGDWERLTTYQKTHFRRLAKAVLEAADAAAWRTIETAPKDGTHILVPMKFIGADVVAFDLGAWRETTSMLRLKDEPTHWQPLPAPPASIAELGGRDGHN